MELKENVWPGERVYRDYLDGFHCPSWSSEKDIRIVQGGTLIGGWDCGNTLRNAFVLLQVRPKEKWEQRVDAVLEVAPDAAMSMEEFAPLVNAALLDYFAKESVHGRDMRDYVKAITHVGDGTVITQTGPRGETSQSVALRHGFAIAPMSNTWDTRRSAVAWLLRRRLTKGKPGFVVSAKNCPVLVAGFEGGYQYPKSSTADQIGPGMVLRMPLKNMYSHVHDGAQYAAMAVQAMLNGGGVKKTTRLKRGTYRMI